MTCTVTERLIQRSSSVLYEVGSELFLNNQCLEPVPNYLNYQCLNIIDYSNSICDLYHLFPIHWPGEIK